jgi:hypothetical protein
MDVCNKRKAHSAHRIPTRLGTVDSVMGLLEHSRFLVAQQLVMLPYDRSIAAVALAGGTVTLLSLSKRREGSLKNCLPREAAKP